MTWQDAYAILAEDWALIASNSKRGPKDKEAKAIREQMMALKAEHGAVDLSADHAHYPVSNTDFLNNRPDRYTESPVATGSSGNRCFTSKGRAVRHLNTSAAAECYKCHLVKDIEEFAIDRSTTGGHSIMCRECCAKRDLSRSRESRK